MKPSTLRHSKGPWSILREGGSHRMSAAGTKDYIMPPGFDVAAPKNEWPQSIAMLFCDSPNCDANAKLIAASPLLLDACRVAYREIGGDNAERYGHHALAEILRTAIEAAT